MVCSVCLYCLYCCLYCLKIPQPHTLKTPYHLSHHHLSTLHSPRQQSTKSPDDEASATRRTGLATSRCESHAIAVPGTCGAKTSAPTTATDERCRQHHASELSRVRLFSKLVFVLLHLFVAACNSGTAWGWSISGDRFFLGGICHS